jgi:hypothetical protein
MMTITFDIITNLKDTTGYPPALEVCAKAFADHITSKLADIRDEQTGESVRIEAHLHPEGLVLRLHGSDSCCAKAETWMLSWTSPKPQLGSESFLMAARTL